MEGKGRVDNQWGTEQQAVHVRQVDLYIQYNFTQCNVEFLYMLHSALACHAKSESTEVKCTMLSVQCKLHHVQCV